MKKSTTILLSAIVLATLAGCGGNSKTDSAWVYDEFGEKRKGDKQYVATLISENTVFLNPPYNKSSFGSSLSIQLSAKDTDVYAIISTGLGFFPESADSQRTISVSFDDKPAELYHYFSQFDFESPDSLAWIYIQEEEKFINNLKTSKTAVVTCEIYENGLHSFTFKTEGLVWDHKNPEAKTE